MSDRKISEFSSITGAGVDVDNDYIEIVDSSAAVKDRNKRITPKELIANASTITQSGSTPTSGTVAAAINDLCFNVKNAPFSAKGDGSTNDASAVQAAITAATTAGGGIIFFPTGVYKLGAGITVPDAIPIIFRGVGIPDESASPASGTELRFTLRDGTTSAIDVSPSSADRALFAMENLLLSGGTYTEALNGPGQGGSALGNAIGLYITNRHRAYLNNVRIWGFDSDGLRLDSAFYFRADSCAFMFNGGAGVNGISANVASFYSCHFQYNVYGTKNLRHTDGCAWEGNWKSGQYYNVSSIEAHHVAPYFELNNSSNTAGEADIYADTTSFPASLTYDSPYFASGSSYSAKPAATYHFTGRCSRLFVRGSMRIVNASPQVYALFNLVGATTMFDSTGVTKNFANFVAFTTNSGGYIDQLNTSIEITLTATTLTHFYYKSVRLTAGSSLNLDNIAAGADGDKLTIIFGDANVTVRKNTGNTRISHTLLSANQSSITLQYDAVGGVWNEICREIPSNRVGTVADVGDTAPTLTPQVSFQTQIYHTAIGADRAVTLSTTNAFNGARFHVVRDANCTGAFNVNVGTGPLVALATAKTWCDVEYNGSAWVLTGYGTLP